MYVCMYVSMYVCMYICIYVCMYIYMCVCASLGACIHAEVDVTHTHIRVRVCACDLRARTMPYQCKCPHWDLILHQTGSRIANNRHPEPTCQDWPEAKAKCLFGFVRNRQERCNCLQVGSFMIGEQLAGNNNGRGEVTFPFSTFHFKRQQAQIARA